MPRVDEIAKELNLTPDEVRTRLSAMGEEVDGDSSEVSQDNVERLRAEVGGLEGAPLETNEEETDAGDATAAMPAADANADDPKATGPVPSPQPPPTTKVERKQ